MAATTLLDLFAAGRRRAGAGAALLERPSGWRMTYGDAERLAAATAGVLARAGVRPGDRVLCSVHKSPGALVAYLATLRLGAVFLPVNPAYTEAEFAHIAGDAEPAVVIADPGRARPAAAGGAVWHTMDATGAGSLTEAAEAAEAGGAGAGSGGQEPAAVEAGSAAVLLYTSGTTGRPKGALLTHSNLAANAETLRSAWGFGADDRLLHALPVYHAHGLLVGVNVTMATGCSMLWLDRFDAGAVVEGLPSATVFMGVPTYYSRLLENPGLDRERCRSVRLFVSGSAPLPAAVFAAWEDRTGRRILERYGMTETLMITSNPLHGERRPGTVGPPLPATEVRVVDGEVQVRGPSVFAGYWRRPVQEFTRDGWFRTGDLGVVEPDGYLRLAGRAKDLVISGGLNVYPKEVEDVLDSLEGVEESAVVGVADADLGEAVAAVVVARPGARLDGDVVRREARARLAGFKVPKSVHVVAALPRNAMGKVEKEQIRRRLRSTVKADTGPG